MLQYFKKGWFLPLIRTGYACPTKLLKFYSTTDDVRALLNKLLSFVFAARIYLLRFTCTCTLTLFYHESWIITKFSKVHFLKKLSSTNGKYYLVIFLLYLYFYSILTRQMSLVLIGELHDIIAPYLGCGGNGGEPNLVPPTPSSDPAALVLVPAEEPHRERAVPPAEELVVLPEGFSPSELLAEAESEPLISYTERRIQLESFMDSRRPHLPGRSMPGAALTSEGASTSTSNIAEVGESSRSLPEPGGGSAVVRLPIPGGTPPSPSVDPRAVSALGEQPLGSYSIRPLEPGKCQSLFRMDARGQCHLDLNGLVPERELKDHLFRKEVALEQEAGEGRKVRLKALSNCLLGELEKQLKLKKNIRLRDSQHEAFQRRLHERGFTLSGVVKMISRLKDQKMDSPDVSLLLDLLRERKPVRSR